MLPPCAAALLFWALCVTARAVDGATVLNDCSCQCSTADSGTSSQKFDSPAMRVRRQADDDEEEDDFGVGQIKIPEIKGLSRANDVSVNSHNGANGFAATGAGGRGGYSVINNYGGGSVSSHSNGAVINAGNRKRSRYY